MALYFYEPVIVIKRSVYAATVDGNPLNLYGARGLHLVCFVAAAGTGTLTLALGIHEPISSVYSQINANKTFTGTGRHHYQFYPGAARQPAGEAASTVAAALEQVVSIALPDRVRASIVKSDGSDWEFSVVAYRIP